MAEHNQQFASKQEWVNKGQSWLTRHPLWGEYFKAICFDAKGRQVTCGGDFRRAEEECAFPVRWLWPDQVAQMAALNIELLEALKEARGWIELAEDMCRDTSAALAKVDALIAKAEAA